MVETKVTTLMLIVLVRGGDLICVKTRRPANTLYRYLVD